MRTRKRCTSLPTPNSLTTPKYTFHSDSKVLCGSKLHRCSFHTPFLSIPSSAQQYCSFLAQMASGLDEASMRRPAQIYSCIFVPLHSSSPQHINTPSIAGHPFVHPSAHLLSPRAPKLHSQTTKHYSQWFSSSSSQVLPSSIRSPPSRASQRALYVLFHLCRLP